MKIGELKKGLNRPSWDMLRFDGHYLSVAIKTGLVTGIISLTVSFRPAHIFQGRRKKDFPLALFLSP